MRIHSEVPSHLPLLGIPDPHKLLQPHPSSLTSACIILKLARSLHRISCGGDKTSSEPDIIHVYIATIPSPTLHGNFSSPVFLSSRFRLDRKRFVKQNDTFSPTSQLPELPAIPSQSPQRWVSTAGCGTLTSVCPMWSDNGTATRQQSLPFSSASGHGLSSTARSRTPTRCCWLDRPSLHPCGNPASRQSIAVMRHHTACRSTADSTSRTVVLPSGLRAGMVTCETFGGVL